MGGIGGARYTVGKADESGGGTDIGGRGRFITWTRELFSMNGGRAKYGKTFLGVSGRGDDAAGSVGLAKPSAGSTESLELQTPSVFRAIASKYDRFCLFAGRTSSFFPFTFFLGNCSKM